MIFSKREDIFVVTNKDYRFRVLDDLEDLGVQIPEENLILEPKAKSTLPAICLAIKAAGNGKFAILPSDHLISVNEDYINAFRIAEKLSEEFLVTFGIKPKKAHTGYGYIRTGEQIGKAFRVEEFKEKPTLALAEEFVNKGYYWNSGMFLFNSTIFLEELAKYQPEIMKVFEKGEKAYEEISEISIDHGLLEKSKKIAMVPLDTEWSDFGNFDALYDIMPKDSEENATLGEVLNVNSKRNLVVVNNLTALIDVEDLIIVDTDDALLISKKGSAERVKEIYRRLKEKGDKRVELHRTAYRPWGSYTLLEENGYKIKRITIKPGRRLSLQRHYHRSEHWIVVKGTARILVDGKELLIRSGESTFVPAGAIHRIENPGKIPLEIIEVQIGEYLEENDIERFEDDYDRC